MRRIFVWVFLFFYPSAIFSQFSPYDYRQSEGSKDYGNVAEDERELDLAESIFRQLRLHLSAAGFPEQIRRLASAGAAAGKSAESEDRERVTNNREENPVKAPVGLRPIEEVLTEVVNKVVVQIIADRKKQESSMEAMSRGKLKELIAEAVEEMAGVGEVGDETPSKNEMSKAEVESMVMRKMVELANNRKSMTRKVNRIKTDGGGAFNLNSDNEVPTIVPFGVQPSGNSELAMKKVMYVVAKTLAKEVVSTEKNYSEVKMSEKQAEMLMVKALTKAQINPKTEELENAKVSPKEMAMALLVEETGLEESTTISGNSVDDVDTGMDEQEMEEKLLDVSEIPRKKLVVKALIEAKINPSMELDDAKMSPKEMKMTKAELERSAIIVDALDAVAELERERVARLEMLRKKLIIKALGKPEMEQLGEAKESSKYIETALLAEEEVLEEAEAMGKAIENLVAEVHEQEAKYEEMRGVAKPEIPSRESISTTRELPSIPTTTARTVMSISKVPTPAFDPKSSFARDFASLETQKEGEVLLPEDLSSIVRVGLHLRKQLYEKLVPKTTKHPAQIEFERRKAALQTLTSTLPSSTASRSASSVFSSFPSSPHMAAPTGRSTTPIISTATRTTRSPTLATSVKTSFLTPTISKGFLTQSTSISMEVPTTMASTAVPASTSRRTTSSKSSSAAFEFETFQSVPLTSEAPFSSGAVISTIYWS